MTAEAGAVVAEGQAVTVTIKPAMETIVTRKPEPSDTRNSTESGG